MDLADGELLLAAATADAACDREVVSVARPYERPDTGPFEVRLHYTSSSAGCAVSGTTAHLTVISTERLPIPVVFELADGAASSQVEVADLP